jgi:hypothetical protein
VLVTGSPGQVTERAVVEADELAVAAEVHLADETGPVSGVPEVFGHRPVIRVDPAPVPPGAAVGGALSGERGDARRRTDRTRTVRPLEAGGVRRQRVQRGRRRRLPSIVG